MVADIHGLLSQLSSDGLRKACRIKNVDMESPRKMDYVIELESYEWNDEETEDLIEAIIEDKEEKRNVASISIYRSETDSPLNSFTNFFERNPISEEANGKLEGFHMDSHNENGIEGTYYFSVYKMIIDKVRMTTRNYYTPVPVNFTINPHHSILLKCFDTMPGYSMKSKKTIEDGTGVSFTIPGLYNFTYIEANNRVNNFLAQLDVAGVSMIDMDVEGHVRTLKRVKYTGADLLNDADIRTYADRGGKIIGFSPIVQYNGNRFECTIKSTERMAYISVLRGRNPTIALAENFAEHLVGLYLRYLC